MTISRDAFNAEEHQSPILGLFAAPRPVWKRPCSRRSPDWAVRRLCRRPASATGLMMSPALIPFLTRSSVTPTKKPPDLSSFFQPTTIRELPTFWRMRSICVRNWSTGAPGSSPTISLLEPMIVAASRSLSAAAFRSPAVPFWICFWSFLISSCNDSMRDGSSSTRQLKRERQIVDNGRDFLHLGNRVPAGNRRDSADALGDSFLADDLEVADRPGAIHVRAAAELDGIVGRYVFRRLGADHDHAHGVRILLAEDGADAVNFLGLGQRHGHGCHRLDR